LQIVHFRLVCRDKDVRRRALSNLPRQQTGSTKVKNDFVPALFLVVSSDVLHYIGEAGCCVNIYLGAVGVVQSQRGCQN
jgi:hypothetical protein